MANTDFTGGAWTEVDGGTYLTVTSSKVAWVDFDRNNTSHHSASAAGLGISLAGDFTHKLEVQYSNLTSSPYIVFWGAFQNVKNLKASIDASEDSLVFFQYQDDFYVVIYEDGVLRDSDKSSGMTAGTTYFITVSYVASTKTVTVEIHTGAHHPAGVHVDSWLLYGTAGISVAHVQVATSYNDGTGSEADGFTQNLDLGAVVNETATPSALVLELVLQAITILGTGTAFIRTFDDALGITDAMGRTQVQLRTFNDGIGNVDDAGRTQVQVRIMDDALGITDAITKTQAFARIIADNIGIVDNEGWFGVSSANLDGYCGQEDGTQLTWALDGANRWYHSTDHTHWFILDMGASHNWTKFRSRSNQTDDPTKVNIYVSETNGDWGAAVAVDISTWQDSAAWVEYNSTDKQGRFIKVEITETENSPAGTTLNYGEGPIFDAYYDDGVVRLMTYARTLAETLGITDAITSLIDFPRTFSDTIGITDDVTATAAYARIVADAMGIVDDVTRTQIQLRVISDALGITDAMTPGQQVTFADAMGITDAITRTQVQVRDFADSLGITDDLTRIAAYIFTQSDDVGIADAMLRVAIALRTIDDDIGMTDARSVSHVVAGSVKAAWAFMIIRQTKN